MDVFVCGVCHAEFHDIVQFMEHKKTLGTYSCSHCSALFHDENQAYLHTRQEHTTENILLQAEQVIVEGNTASDKPQNEEPVDAASVSSHGISNIITTVTNVEQLGDVTFVPCSDGNITLMGNIQIIHAEDNSDHLLAVTSLHGSGNIEKESDGTSTVIALQQETQDSTRTPQTISSSSSSSDAGKIVSAVSDASSISDSKSRHNHGIFACIKCNTFSSSMDEMREHLLHVHQQSSISGDDIKDLIVHLVPLANLGAQERGSKSNSSLKLLAGNSEETTRKDSIRLVLEHSHVEGNASSECLLKQPVTTKRKRGRPKKSETQKAEQIEKSILPERPASPVVCDADGLYHCSQCKKAFRKERHIRGHKCMGVGEYVDPSFKDSSRNSEGSGAEPKEGVEDEMRETEIDTDSTADFQAYVPRGKRSIRRRNRKRSFEGSSRKPNDFPVDNKAVVDVKLIERSVPDNQTKAQEQENVLPLLSDETSLADKKGQADGTADNGHNQRGAESVLSQVSDKNFKVNWRDDPQHVPVFSNYQERIEFEDMLTSVDLSCVDHLYSSHQVAQEIDVNKLAKVTVRENNELLVYACNICKKIFKSRSHMRLHCLIHTDMKPFQCPKCPYRSNAKGTLYTHMRRHTGNCFKCSQCDFQSCNKSHLAEHEATHSSVRHTCKICHNPYSTKKSLVNHIRRYHTTAAGHKYLASFMVRSQNDMAVLHKCHICNRKFKKKVDRDRHLFVHNVKDNVCLLRCRICDYASPRRSYLENHQRKHRLVYICCLCNKTFVSSVVLRKHLEEHLNETANKTPNNNQNVSQTLDNENRKPESAMDVQSGAPLSLTDNTKELNSNASSNSLELENNDESKASKPASDPVVNISKKSDNEPFDFKSPSLNSLFDTSISRSWYLPEPNGSFGMYPYAMIPGELMSASAPIVLDNVEDIIVEDATNNMVKRQPSFNTSPNLEYKPLTVKIYMKIRETFGHAECEICGRLFHSYLTLEPHLLTHEKTKPFKCQECSYSACTKDNLRRHQETIHEGRSFECDQCKYMASSRTSLWHHKQKHLFKVNRCQICDLQLASLRKLKEHLMNVHPDAEKEHVKQMIGSHYRIMGRLGRHSYKCPYCDKIFHRSSTDLQKHIWVHEGVKPYKCSLCSHTCRSQNNLNIHMLRHTQEKPHLCEECGKAYKSKASLRCHLKLHEQGSTSTSIEEILPSTSSVTSERSPPTEKQDQSYTCNWCGYKSTSFEYLRVHYLRRHQNMNPIKKRAVAKENAVQATISEPIPAEVDPQQMFKCVTCECIFQTIEEVKEHLQDQHGLPASSIELTELPLPSECAANEESIEKVEGEAPVLPAQVDMEQEASVCEVVIQSEANHDNNTSFRVPFQMPKMSGDAITEMDEKTVSAVNMVQEILKQGALSSQMSMQSGNEENYLSANPETIIVQNVDREVVLRRASVGQYVVESIRDRSQAEINATDVYAIPVQEESPLGTIALVPPCSGEQQIGSEGVPS